MNSNESMLNNTQDSHGYETLDDFIEEMSDDQEFVDLMADARRRREVVEDLVKLRKDVANMSLREFARLLELSAATVSEFEKQAEDPRLSTVQRYARAVGHEVVITLAPVHRASLAARARPDYARRAASNESVDFTRVSPQSKRVAGWARAAESRRTDFGLAS